MLPRNVPTPPNKTQRNEPSRTSEQRGIAMVLCLVFIALMTAMVVDANGSARARIIQAGRHRDAVQAQYLAQSGVRFYLLLLAMGGQIRQMLGGNAQMVEDMLGVSLDDALWKSIPFLDTGLLRMVSSGASTGLEEGDLQSLLTGSGEPDTSQLSDRQREKLEETHEQGGILRHGWLEFPGDFRAEIHPSEGGFNVNNLVAFERSGQPLQMNPVARALQGLFSRPEYKEMFEDELKIDPWDLVANLKDWADADSQGSGPLGGWEDSPYQDREFPYGPKNARYLTHREMQLVPGMTDRAYGMFAPALTVWGKAVNINAASKTVLWGVIRGFASPNLSDQQITDALNHVYEVHFGILDYPKGKGGVNRFLSEIESQGITWETPDARKALANDVLTTASEYFTIRSTGMIRETERTIEVTIRFMPRGSSSSFRILQWREQ